MPATRNHVESISVREDVVNKLMMVKSGIEVNLLWTFAKQKSIAKMP